jgi:hypothetical protein
MIGFLDTPPRAASCRPARREQLLVADEHRRSDRKAGQRRGRVRKKDGLVTTGTRGAGDSWTICWGWPGIALILAIAFLLSSNRRAIRLRVVAAAFALQAGIAVLVLYTPWGRAAIEGMAQGVSNLLGYANKGTEFLFGPAPPTRSPTPSRSARCR